MSTTENLTATKSSGKAIDITLIALFAALMAICSWISIPLTVPFTLQTFAVFVTLEIIGGKRGTLSILVFLLLGAIGVPVFAGFKSGVAVLLGTTGGYLIGFLCTALIYWLFTSLLGNPRPMILICTFFLNNGPTVLINHKAPSAFSLRRQSPNIVK